MNNPDHKTFSDVNSESVNSRESSQSYMQGLRKIKSVATIEQIKKSEFEADHKADSNNEHEHTNVLKTYEISTVT